MSWISGPSDLRHTVDACRRPAELPDYAGSGWRGIPPRMARSASAKQSFVVPGWTTRPTRVAKAYAGTGASTVTGRARDSSPTSFSAVSFPAPPMRWSARPTASQGVAPPAAVQVVRTGVCVEDISTGTAIEPVHSCAPRSVSAPWPPLSTSGPP